MTYRLKTGPGSRRNYPVERRPRFAVIGCGHGGQAMAAYLGLKGFEVRVYNKSPERVEPITYRGGIELDGEVRGFAPVALASTDIGTVLEGADVIMVAVPASAHLDIARLCAPHLVEGQIILLNPGRTGGALEFRHALREAGVNADVVVAEAQTFIFASRSMGPAQSRIYRIKNVVPVAALPSTRTARALEPLREAFPQFVAARNVLKTSLDNMGAIFHPALTILNAGRIESSQGNFDYYHEGITPSVARILEAMDNERVTVAGALGVRALTAREWLESAYGAGGSSLYEAVLNNEGYKGIKAPPNLAHRYLFEDVPCSLVPISSLGRMLGVPTPTIDHIIHLACLVHNADYWSQGRTVGRLGLEGMTADQISLMVNEGAPAS